MCNYFSESDAHLARLDLEVEVIVQILSHDRQFEGTPDVCQHCGVLRGRRIHKPNLRRWYLQVDAIRLRGLLHTKPHSISITGKVQRDAGLVPHASLILSDA